MALAKELTTGQLSSLITHAESPEEVLACYKGVPMPAFKDLLYSQMQSRSLTAKEMIRLSGIERSYFYHILSGHQVPGRNMVLRIALCMELGIGETNALLRLAGASGLYARFRRDGLLIYAVSHHLSMSHANEILLTAGEAPLYREEKSG